MSNKSYEQFCGIAKALDLIGERWSLLIVRELLLGPKRFKDLTEALPGIGTNILTTRLGSLEESKVVVKRRLPRPAAAMVYELTEYGRQLEPILLQLLRWGARSLDLSEEPAIRSNWIGLLMKSFYRPDLFSGPTTAALTLPTGILSLSVIGGALSISEVESPNAELQVQTSEEVLMLLLRGEITLSSAIHKKKLTLSGDEAELRALLSAFPIRAL